jgi:outer membrane protein assembly factor BamB
VFIGSYDGRFYALDARSGKTRWTRHLGTKISGSATIIGDLVFVSDLNARASWALGTGTGQTVWKTGRGGFNPAISDGRRIYFNGYSSLFALDPAGIHYDQRKAKQAKKKAAAKKKSAAKKKAAKHKRARHKRQSAQRHR